MKDVSIWLKRIIYLANVKFKDKGYSMDKLLDLIKHVKKIPYVLSRVKYTEGVRERIWYSNRRLGFFINLAVLFNIYEIRNSVFYKTKNALIVLDSKTRYSCLKEKASYLLENRFGVTDQILLDAFNKINSPVTAKILTRYLKIIIAYEDLILFEALLEIYFDVNEIFVWTGKITFGKNYQIINLENELSDPNKEYIRKICKNCRKKNICIKRVKDAIKQGHLPATLEKEALKLCIDILEKQKVKDVKSAEKYIKEINNN
ncbi:MAG: hypothetical protein ACFFCI_01330 [Promethearchaeota archaeon]